MTLRRLLPGLLLALLLADLLGWYGASLRLRDLYEQFRARALQAGWQLDPAKPALAFSPFAASLLLRAPALRQPGGAGFTAPSLRVAVSLFHPHQLRLATAGALTLAMPGGPPIPFHADQVAIHLSPGPHPGPHPGLQGGIGQARLTARGLELPTRLGPLTIRATALDLAWAPSFLTLTLTLADTSLDAASRLGLGTAPGHFALALAASPSWPGGPAAAAATAWRAAGGQVRLDRASLDWGPLHATATGTLGLDPALQPDARLALHLPDPSGLLAALSASGALAPGPALAAGAFLSVLGSEHPGGSEQPGGATLPLRLKSSTLTLARIPLLRIPPLAWPTPATPPRD